MQQASKLTEGLKQDLERLWHQGHRSLVLTTFMVAATVGDRDVALWIHARFKHDFTAAELEELGVFAAQILVVKFAEQLAANIRAQSSVDAERAAKDVIARAMAH
jgi:hypothetical protein